MDHRSEPTPLGAIKSLDELRKIKTAIYHTFPLNGFIEKFPPPLKVECLCWDSNGRKSCQITWTNNKIYDYWVNNVDGAPFAPFGGGNGWIFTNYWHAWAYCQRRGYKD